MTKATQRFSLSLVVLLLTGFSLAQDREGSQDHPLITRYPGSTILLYHHQKYGEFEVPTGRLKGNQIRILETVAGEMTRIFYVVPQEHSAAEVFRNYESALANNGFKTIFKAVGRKDLGASPRMFKTKFSKAKKFPEDENVYVRNLFGNCIDGHYLAARSPNGYTVALFVAASMQKKGGYVGHPMVQLEVIESEAVVDGLITVTAQEHYEQLAAEGRSSLPSDVLFDLDKAVLKAEAGPVLAEAAKLLQEHPELRLYVVGHTDITGTLEHNTKLSSARAKAVVTALTSQYGIAPARLQASGLGPLAPLTENISEQGRARNRRVEFVPRP